MQEQQIGDHARPQDGGHGAEEAGEQSRQDEGDVILRVGHEGAPDLADHGAEHAPEDDGAAAQPVGDGGEEEGAERHAGEGGGVLDPVRCLAGQIGLRGRTDRIRLLHGGLAIDLGLLREVELPGERGNGSREGGQAEGSQNDRFAAMRPVLRKYSLSAWERVREDGLQECGLLLTSGSAGSALGRGTSIPPCGGNPAMSPSRVVVMPSSFMLVGVPGQNCPFRGAMGSPEEVFRVAVDRWPNASAPGLSPPGKLVPGLGGF